MTDEEKREKAIEELHSILLSDCRRYSNHTCPRNTCSECAAARIYDNYILRKEDEARRELIDKLISVGEACNGMVSVPVLKAWKIEFEDIDLEEWKKLEGGDNND